MLESGEESPPSLVGFLFEHLAGLGARAGVTTTGQSLAHLVAALGRPGAGERVVDPACGEGQLLCAAALRAGDAALVGRDNDVGALLTAEAVLKLNNVTADLDGGPTDSLETGTDLGPADLVLLDPPLGGGRHVVRWLRLATELSPDGRAVVVLPGDALRRGRREWTTVAERVVAVIACPARLRADTGEAPSVWVLGRDRTDDVLVVDAASPGAASFGVEQAEQLASAINEWRLWGRVEAAGGHAGAWRCRARTSLRREESFDPTIGRPRCRRDTSPLIPKSMVRGSQSSGIPSRSPRSFWNRSARRRIRVQRNLGELWRSSWIAAHGQSLGPNPDALTAGRVIAARNAASDATRVTCSLARVTAVYRSSRVRIGEGGGGRVTMTRRNSEPWLLWMVVAHQVSTSPSWDGASSRTPLGLTNVTTGSPEPAMTIPTSPLDVRLE